MTWSRKAGKVSGRTMSSWSATALARMAQMSESAFHRTFRTVTGMSPIRFQKQLRLHEARLILAARTHDVTGVAHTDR